MQRFILVPMLGIATLAASAPARAQSDWLGRAPASYAEQRSSYYDARQAAYDNGYREGLKEGQKDGRRNETFRYQDEKTYQRADKGYHREFGDVNRYRQSFRSGYADGYSAAYQRGGPVYDRGDSRNGRYGDSRDGRYGDSRGGYGDPRVGSGGGRYPGYPQGYPNGSRGYGGVAFQNGADDGFEKGQEDARKGRSFDPVRHAWYRAGDRRYESRAGSRDEYRDTYRRGFQEGYDRGYREGRYR